MNGNPGAEKTIYMHLTGNSGNLILEWERVTKLLITGVFETIKTNEMGRKQ
jgi:hypothetical protein